MLGYTPRTPDVLQVDTTGPVLQRWYLNHHTTSSSNRISVLLFFDEPVELLDATSIKLYYSTLGAGGGIALFEDWYPLTHSDTSQQQRVSVTYNNFNREVTIELVDYCKVNVTSGQGCTSSTSSTVASGASRATQTLFAFLSRPTLRTDSTSRHRYFLSILPRAVQDKARSPVTNPVQQIVARKAIREDQPGIMAQCCEVCSYRWCGFCCALFQTIQLFFGIFPRFPYLNCFTNFLLHVMKISSNFVALLRGRIFQRFP